MGFFRERASRSGDWYVPAWVRWSPAVIVPALIAYVASTFLREPGSAAIWDTAIGLPLTILAAVLTGVRAVKFKSERIVWALASAAITSWITGNVVYNFVILEGPNPSASPNIADIFWLAFYPLMIGALVIRIHRRVVRHLQGAFMIDGLIAGLGACAVMIDLLVSPLLAKLDGSASAVLVHAAYPIGDELLLGMAVAVLAVSGRARLSRTWGALVVAQVLYMLADTILLTQTANGTYQFGTPLDAVWVVAALMVAFAAWQPPETQPAVVANPSWRVLVIPYIFTAAAVFVLVHDHWSRTSTAAVVLASLTLLVAAGRTFETLRQLRALSEARHLAATDELTNLPNRRELFRLIRAAMDVNADAKFALLIVDLDWFKDINDTLGHQAGDDLIVQLAPRMVGAMRPGDTVARIGGDEFAVLLPNTDAAEALVVAGRLRDEIARPMEIAGAHIVISATIGIAVSPTDTTDVTDLLRFADTAMYRARNARLGVAVYDEATDRRDTERLLLIQELRTAMDTDELVLFYQPKATLLEGALVGVEALVRWKHPRLGILVPPMFLPLAEQAGLMRRLTERVLDVAIKQAAEWGAQDKHICMSVNMTAADVRDLSFPSFVQAKLAAYGVDPRMLMLEITEQDLVLDRQQGASNLDILRELGIRVSIDDYGTGYSSLSYLSDLPVDELKLDREFVQRMLVHERAGIVVRSSVQLAKSLGLTIVAEGVETIEEWDALRDAGCDLAQGYLLGRPMPAADFDVWLANRPAPTRGDSVTIPGTRTTP